MSQADRASICHALQRDAPVICRSAARNFLPYLSVLLRTEREVGEDGAAVPTRPAAISDDPAEQARMVEDGFRRLGALLGVSILVDEPALIADDLEWLHDLLSARGIPGLTQSWMENMVRIYVGACEGLLAEAELELLRAVSERGLTILSERQVGTSKDGS